MDNNNINNNNNFTIYEKIKEIISYLDNFLSC